MRPSSTIVRTIAPNVALDDGIELRPRFVEHQQLGPTGQRDPQPSPRSLSLRRMLDAGRRIEGGGSPKIFRICFVEARIKSLRVTQQFADAHKRLIDAVGDSPSLVDEADRWRSILRLNVGAFTVTTDSSSTVEIQDLPTPRKSLGEMPSLFNSL